MHPSSANKKQITNYLAITFLACITHLFGIWVGIEWQEGDHLLVREFILLSTLDHTIQNQCAAKSLTATKQ